MMTFVIILKYIPEERKRQTAGSFASYKCIDIFVFDINYTTRLTT